MPAMDLVKKTKVTFINDLFHIKGKGICKEVLIKEYEQDKVNGLVKEVKGICTDLDIDDVSMIKSDLEKLFRSWVPHKRPAFFLWSICADG